MAFAHYCWYPRPWRIIGAHMYWLDGWINERRTVSLPDAQSARHDPRYPTNVRKVGAKNGASCGLAQDSPKFTILLLERDGFLIMRL